MITNVTKYKCVQRYLDDHRRRGKFTRWELARRPGRRPHQWLVWTTIVSTQKPDIRRYVGVSNAS